MTPLATSRYQVAQSVKRGFHRIIRGPNLQHLQREQHLHTSHGGVPWYLMLLYIGFLVFFTWYTLEYQLPDYLEKGPDALKPTAEAAK